MSSVAQIQADLIRGRALYSDLNQEYISEMKKGCMGCKPENYTFLGELITSLTWETGKGTVNDIAEVNYEALLLILGTYVVFAVPQVSAGDDQSLPVGGTAVFNAVITPGSASITSILWTKLSGASDVVLTGANTASLSVSGYGLGQYVFQIAVTDAVGNVATDAVMLTGVNMANTINFGYSVTNPFGVESGVTLQFTKGIGEAVSEYLLDFTNGANLNYLVVSEPATEPIKTAWVNETNNNKGFIPDSRIRAGVVIGSRRYYISRVPFPLYLGISTITFKVS